MANLKEARELTRQLLMAKSGDTLTKKRAEGQTAEQFAGALMQQRTQWKNKYGITTRSTIVGDTATIFVVNGIAATETDVAERLQTKSNGAGRAVFPLRFASPVAAPAPTTPPPEPVFEVEDDDARQFWKEMLIESMRVSPGAPFAVHANNAKQAVLEYQSAWKAA